MGSVDMLSGFVELNCWNFFGLIMGVLMIYVLVGGVI